MRRKYLPFILLFIVLIIIIPLSFLFIEKHTKEKISSHYTPVPVPSNGTYITEDSSVAPSVSYGAVEGTITRQTREYENHIWQSFVLHNQKTGSTRVIFEQPEDTTSFEKMSSQNWSPTNRFFYVFFDLTDGRRNFLIFETDGRFTNSQYYLQPIQLKPEETVIQAFWKDGETFEFTLLNQKNNTKTLYEVDLNDSTGTVSAL